MNRHFYNYYFVSASLLTLDFEVRFFKIFLSFLEASLFYSMKLAGKIVKIKKV